MNWSILKTVFLVLNFIFSFLLSVGTGANDIGNSFGSVYGANLISWVKIVILASVFEFIGALMLGNAVSETLRVKIFNFSQVLLANSPGPLNRSDSSPSSIKAFKLASVLNANMNFKEIKLLCGYLSIVLSCCIWSLYANYKSLPISTTQSIVGAIIGFAFCTLHGKALHWYTIIEIFASWVITPIISGIVSVLLYWTCKKIKVKYNLIKSTRISFIWDYVVYFSVLFVVTISFITNEPMCKVILMLDKIDGKKILYSSLISTLISAAVVLIHLLVSKFSRTPNKEENIDELSSIIVATRQNSDGTSKDDFVVFDEGSRSILTSLSIAIACYAAYAHGGNDVSNCISPLISTYQIYSNSIVIDEQVQDWLIIYGSIGMILGLIFYGKRILKTFGVNLTEISLETGFFVDFGSVVGVTVLTQLGIPISTTHCKIGSIVGMGWYLHGFNSINPGLLADIVISWFVTVPASAVICAILYILMSNVLITCFI